MLAQFVIKKTFCRVSVSLYVDNEAKTADLMIKEGRLIRKSSPVIHRTVETPELAETYLRHQVDVGNGTLGFMEYLDYCAARQLGVFSRAP